jgi:hypothetical protein
VFSFYKTVIRPDKPDNTNPGPEYLENLRLNPE